MIHLWSIPRRFRFGARGFTIMEAVVSMAVASILVLAALWGLLFGMSQARAGQNRAAAATWAEAEISYLALQGYTPLSTTTWPYTLTQTSGYHTYNGGGLCAANCIPEPTIPAGFDHAVIDGKSAVATYVWQITVTLYQTPTKVYATFSTYVSSYTHA